MLKSLLYVLFQFAPLHRLFVLHQHLTLHLHVHRLFQAALHQPLQVVVPLQLVYPSLIRDEIIRNVLVIGDAGYVVVGQLFGVGDYSDVVYQWKSIARVLVIKL